MHPIPPYFHFCNSSLLPPFFLPCVQGRPILLNHIHLPVPRSLCQAVKKGAAEAVVIASVMKCLWNLAVSSQQTSCGCQLLKYCIKDYPVSKFLKVELTQ